MLNIPGYNELLEKSLASLALNVVDNTVRPLKFMYKLSSFDTAVRERIAFKRQLRRVAYEKYKSHTLIALIISSAIRVCGLFWA